LFTKQNHQNHHFFSAVLRGLSCEDHRSHINSWAETKHSCQTAAKLRVRLRLGSLPQGWVAAVCSLLVQN
jgi:hypothetical protein